MMPAARLLPWLVIAASLVGCMGGKDKILPQGGPTMKEVYDAHFDRNRQHHGESARQSLGPRSANVEAPVMGWIRESQSEIEQLFPRLPNPDLVMYVFPHLSPEGHPVPGYTTSFPMYERVEYALPGEAEGR